MRIKPEPLTDPLEPSLSSETTSLDQLRLEVTDYVTCLPISNLATNDVSVSEPTLEALKTEEAGASTTADANTEPVDDDGVDECSAELSVAADGAKTFGDVCQPLQQPKASKSQYVTGRS